MFTTIADYEQFIYTLGENSPSILSSTLRVIRSGPAAGQVIGGLAFANGIRLEVAELIDLEAGRLEILQYGYVVWQGSERLYWYDSQAHPNDSTLASTHPHHKHIPAQHQTQPHPRARAFLHRAQPALSDPGGGGAGGSGWIGGWRRGAVGWRGW